MLEFTKVRKIYGERPILAIPSLRLENGIYWLQGANGSGKTTLLRIIAGLLPFAGDIEVNGVSLRREPLAYRRTVNWADAEPLYPGFVTGEDLISFYQGIQRPPAGQAEELAGRFGMRGYLSTPLGTWSGGMTKKLSLLLAFLGHPGWVVLDEPLNTLDGETIPGLYALIASWHALYGTGFLVSSNQDITAERVPVTGKLLVQDQTISLMP